jgi:hypothetical protein
MHCTPHELTIFSRLPTSGIKLELLRHAAKQDVHRLAPKGKATITKHSQIPNNKSSITAEPKGRAEAQAHYMARHQEGCSC